MAWQLRARLTETCSCNMFCPCWFGVKDQMIMDQGYCAGSLCFEIEDGQSNGVSLAGRTVVLLADWPGPTLLDGKGTARLFIDDKANKDHVRELTAIFQGQKGGAMEVVASLISTWLPVKTTSIQTSRDGDTVSVKVGSVGQITSRAVRDEQGTGFTIKGGGFISAFGMDEAELAPGTGTTWSDPDMPRAFVTRSGARGVAKMSA